MALIRKERYPIEFVLKQIKPHVPRQKNIVDFDGDLIELESQRYRLFNSKGTKCVECGLEAEYFSKEKTDNPNIKKFHLNLYGTRNGTEILFTKDHIMPKSKGGKNHMKNYAVMCSTCNAKKADTYDPKLTPVKQTNTKFKKQVRSQPVYASKVSIDPNTLLAGLLTVTGLAVICVTAGITIAVGTIITIVGYGLFKLKTKT